MTTELLAHDVAQMATGELPPTAVKRLAEVGQWMAVNSEAIHDTMPQHPYAITVEGATDDGGGGDTSAVSAQTNTSFEWRLTRKGAVVYASLLLEPGAGQQLPRCNSLALPFVIGLPGGVDGTWPQGTLSAVSLLGSSESVGFTLSNVNGLALTINASMTVAAPFVAVFKLNFSPDS